MVNCNICGCEESKVFIKKLNIVRCTKCKHVYRNKYSALPKMYRRSYFKIHDDIEDRLSYNNRYLQLIKRYKKKGKLLEIGCAGGFLLHLAKEFKCYGVDISPYAIDFAQKEFNLTGLSVGEAESINYPDNYFDVIVSINTLEHCKYPRIVLDKAYKCLKPNGIIVLCVPNLWNMYISKWKDNSMFCKEHLHYFTPKHLLYLVRRNGYELLYLKSRLLMNGIYYCLKKLGIAKQINNKTFNNATLSEYNDFNSLYWRIEKMDSTLLGKDILVVLKKDGKSDIKAR